jgi:hypothetical protein
MTTASYFEVKKKHALYKFVFMSESQGADANSINILKFSPADAASTNILKFSPADANSTNILKFRGMLHTSTAPLPMGYTSVGYTSMRYTPTALYFYKHLHKPLTKSF